MLKCKILFFVICLFTVNNFASGTNSLSLYDEIIAEIIKFEDFREKPYKDSYGRISIGYGTTSKGSVFKSKEEALQDAKNHLYMEVYQPIFKTGVKTSKNEFKALAIFTYNTGQGSMRNIVKSGKVDCDRMLLYNKIKKLNKKTNKVELVYSKGLNNRRLAEHKLCKS